MNDSLEILQSRPIIDMLTIANEFCIFTENVKEKSMEDTINFYQKILPLMYLKGSLLPEIEVSDETANERFITEEHWENVFLAVQEVLGPKDYFLSIDSNNQAVKTSVADHIADIYQDMKDFLMLFQKNRTIFQENAVFECKRFFEHHWGQRASILIPYLHVFLYPEKEEDFE